MKAKLLLLVLIIALLITACGGGNGNNRTTKSNNDVQITPMYKSLGLSLYKTYDPATKCVIYMLKSGDGGGIDAVCEGDE